jgi:hypothetical protein
MATSNAAGLTLPKEAVAQFEALLRYLDRLPEIIEKSRHSEYGITIFQVLRPISREENLPYSDLLDAFTALQNLRFMEDEFGSAEDVLDRIESATTRELSKKIRENRIGIFKALDAYRTDNPISVAFKAQRLAYYYERVLRDIDIITDIRPIFDANGEKVLEIIISHSLVIRQSSSGRTERFHLTMDAADVVELRKACDRAIVKANALKQAFGGPDHDWKVQILRDSDAS